MILYLHGFRSSSSSLKARQLRQYLEQSAPEVLLWCEDLHHSPATAIAEVERAITGTKEKPLLVGSSLGGYYATYLAERYNLKAVLINPACNAADLLEPWVGPQVNLYSGESFELSPADIRDLRLIHVPHLSNPARFWVLLETGDEVLDYRVAIETYQGAKITVIEGGNHGLESFPQFLPGIVDLSL